MGTNVKIPITRSDAIASYRKKNSAIRHEYYTLCDKYSHLDKSMFTFTATGKGRGVYTKLRLINEIKSYVTYLIANSTAEIYFFSNIEIGHSFSNPHLHTQIWSDDKDAVREIYERVIKKFELVSKRCALSEPQHALTHYNYIIKDYSKDLNADEVWNLEKTKYRMRKTLGLKLRFYSKSKSKYTSKLYKMVYHSYKVLRALADEFIDFMVNTFFLRKSLREDVLENKRLSKLSSISSFITIKNKGCMFADVWVLTLTITTTLEILFYSPAHSPPLSTYFLLFAFWLRGLVSSLYVVLHFVFLDLILLGS